MEMTDDDKRKFGDDSFGRQMHAHLQRDRAKKREDSIRRMACRVVAGELALGKDKEPGFSIDLIALNAVARCTEAFDVISSAGILPKKGRL